MKKENRLVLAAGVAVGLAALALTALGNPGNMGFCIACFERDIAGAVGLHSAAKVQYVRPEIIGLVLGICIGIVFLRRGFDLKRSYPARTLEGTTLPAVMTGLLLLVLLVPSVLHFSTEGPGSKHAPFFIALVIAVVVGALAQKSRLCMVGGIRDTIMLRDAHLLWGFIAIFAVVLAGNLILGNFKLGFDLQPIAHSSHLWNLLGMVLVGWGSVLLGGCPLRQLILAGSGNGDSAVTVFGMIVGAAFAHNFALAGNPDALNDAKELVVGGIGTNGKIAVAVGFVVLLAISLINSRQKEVQT